MADRKYALPGTSEYLLRVAQRTEEMLWARVQAMRRNEAAATEPSAEELRDATEHLIGITDPAEFEQAMVAFVQRYKQENLDLSLARALRRRQRDEGEA